MLDRKGQLEINAAIVRSGKYAYQLADELSISQDHFYQFLRGRRKLPEDKLSQLQELLGLQTVATGLDDGHAGGTYQ
jgi:hypothetical protein